MIPLAGLLNIGGKLIDKLIPDPEAKAKAQLDLAKADMGSDSWLSKNIRPMTLIAIFVGYFMFAMMSAFGYNANEAYVTLLGQWGMLVMSFYFGGRTLEKIIDMKAKK